MPASFSVKLLPKIMEGLESSYQLLLPHKIGALLPHLARGDEVKSAIDLAGSVLRIDPLPDKDESTAEGILFREPLPRIRLSDYEDILTEHMPAVIEAGKQQAVELLCDLLDSALRPARDGTPDDEEDYSHIWRPSIEHDGARVRDDAKNLLVSSIRDAFEQIGQTAPSLLQDLVEVLESRRRPIFRRLVLHLLRRFPDKSADNITTYLTDRNLFDDDTVWNEYSLLLESHFAGLPDDGRMEIFHWIQDGPIIDEEVRREWEPGKLKRSIERWQLSHLWPLRRNLPQDWQIRLEQLVEKYGEPPAPESLSAVTTWVGPTSPKNSDELRIMNTEQIVSFLGNWNPPIDPMGPSPEGLGRILTDVVASQPGRFAEAASLFMGLDPTYIRALISGFRDALKGERPFPWPPVINLSSWALKQPREIPGREGRYADLDPGWVWTRQAISGLLSLGLEKRAGVIPLNLRTEVWSILQVLTDDPDPTLEREAKYGGTNMDPPTLAINTVRGEAMHAVVRYGLWLRRHQAEAPNSQELIAKGFEEMKEVRGALDKHLDPMVDPSQAIRSVYGQWFPWLILLDRNWASANLARIFPLDADQAPLYLAAWETYISFCAPYDDAFDLLRPIYAKSVNELSTKGAKETRKVRDPERSLAEHLMTFYWRGKLGFDSIQGLLPRFFERADIEIRRRAIEFIGRSLKQSTRDQTSDQVRARLRDLWDRRITAAETSPIPGDDVKELEGFGWWFVSNQFDDEWLVSELSRLLRLGGQPEPAHLVVEKLAMLVDRLPLDAVKILRLMVEGAKESWAIDAWLDEARLLLSKALASSDTEAREEAKTVVHLLGARRYFDFRDLLTSGEEPVVQ
jgi:hypothetical protein